MSEDLKHVDFLFEYLQEAHRFQMERLDTIRERISFIGGFLLLLGTGVCSLLNAYKVQFGDHKARDWVFLGGISLASVLLIISSAITAWCLLRRYRYANAKSAGQILQHAKDWGTYNAKVETAKRHDIAIEIKDQLCQLYACSADFNQKLNNRRNDLLILSMKLAFASALLSLLPAYSLVASKYQDPSDVIQVNVTNPLKVNLK